MTQMEPSLLGMAENVSIFDCHDYTSLDKFRSTFLSDVDEHETPKEYPDFDLSAISKMTIFKAFTKYSQVCFIHR